MTRFSVFGILEPSTVEQNDNSVYTLGTEFHIPAGCTIVAVRFWHANPSSGDRVWQKVVIYQHGNSTRLLEVDITDARTPGWTEVELTTPVVVNSDGYYIASVFTDSLGSGNDYPGQSGFFNVAKNSIIPNLYAPANGDANVYGNGLYNGADALPTSTYGATWYGIDLVVETNLTPDINSYSIFGSVPNDLIPDAVASVRQCTTGIKFTVIFDGFESIGARYYLLDGCGWDGYDVPMFLWKSDGTLIAQGHRVQLVGDSPGWIDISWDSGPVDIPKGDYVVAYHTGGHSRPDSTGYPLVENFSRGTLSTIPYASREHYGDTPAFPGDADAGTPQVGADIIVRWKQIAAVNYVYARPSADTVITGWTDQAGGSTNLYQKIDEDVLDTADYIKAVSS